MATAFADKLALVLRALAISRGRLAAELGINKSVVSRWHSGQAQPTDENLSRVTRFVADRLPGFTGLDWDRDTADFVGLFTRRRNADEDDAPAANQLKQTREYSARYGASWEGHYWGYRRPFQPLSGYTVDMVRICRRGNDLIFQMHHDILRSEGAFMVGDGKGYALLPHRYSAIPAIVMLYLLDGRPMQIMDGMITALTISAAREMVAEPYVLVRAAGLRPDPAEDDAYFDSRLPNDWTIAETDLPPQIIQRLNAPGGEIAKLRVSSADSIARFATPDELAAAP